MVRIVHFSDWHASLPSSGAKLPEADIYVCTGDMLPDYHEKGGQLNVLKTRTLQGRFIRGNPFREFLPRNCRDAPVVAVRGNHDWVNLGAWFGGLVYEFGKTPQVFNILGYKFSGFRGVGRINGTFSDELEPGEGQAKINEIPNDIHFLVTHSPPLGILDSVNKAGSVHRLGLQCLINLVNRQLYEGGTLIGHFFGHIHDQWGFSTWPPSALVSQGNISRTIGFSNASTGYIAYNVKNGRLSPNAEMHRLFID